MFNTFASDPSVRAAAVLGSLFFLAAGFNQLMRLVDRLKEKPIPSETYVTKAEFRAHTETQERRHHTLEERLDAAREARATDRKDVLEEITNLRSEIREDMSRVHQRVDDLPTQFVAILRNTGAIK